MKTLILFTFLVAALASIQNPFDCTGSYNNQTLIDVAPLLVDTVPNGKKYIIGNNELYILALNGSWYDMGLAYGQLMKDELSDAIPGMYDYLANQTDVVLNVLKDDLPFFLKWIPNLLEMEPKQLMGALLGLLHDSTNPYTPQRYKDQLKGISDGAGIDLTLLANLNLLPDLIKAECSMAGIWGPASYDGKLLQLRALDWDYLAYVVRFPTAVIYFSEEEGSNPFATFGFAGMIGAISGYSPKIALSEKAWLPASTNIKQRFGQPFPYVLRDMLQFGNDLESAVGVLFNATRTCQIHVGIGSRADNSFEGCRISFEALEIYNDKNFTNFTSNHPQMDGVMFWDKETLQPSNTTCMGGLLQEGLGKIDPQYLYRTVTALEETGDTQVIVYEFENSTVYIAYSDPVNGVKAYTRPLIKLDMGALLDINYIL